MFYNDYNIIHDYEDFSASLPACNEWRVLECDQLWVTKDDLWYHFSII